MMTTRKPVPSGEQSWAHRAACKGQDPELWFPPPQPNATATNKEREASKVRRLEQEARAKAICFGCPVRPECYDHAVTNELYGIWGGTTETERGLTPLR